MMIKIDPVAYARKIGVNMGEDIRLIGLTEKTFGSEPYLISLGYHVTIAGGVRFITHDGGIWVFRQDENDIELIRPIKIGNNSFIGFGVIILPGIEIGSNVIIGAGAIVSSNIPDSCVAAGTPARVIESLEEYRKKISPYLLRREWKNEAEKRKILEEMFQISTESE